MYNFHQIYHLHPQEYKLSLKQQLSTYVLGKIAKNGPSDLSFSLDKTQTLKKLQI